MKIELLIYTFDIASTNRDRRCEAPAINGKRIIKVIVGLADLRNGKLCFITALVIQVGKKKGTVI